MRKLLLPFLIVAIYISSCNLAQKHDSQEFYTKIIYINDTLEKLTVEWHSQLDKAILQKNFVDLGPYRTALGAFISRGRSAVANMTPPPGGDKIQAIEDELLVGQSDLVAEAYPKFERYSEYTPKEDLDKSLAPLTNDVANVKSQSSKIFKKLEEFATKNNLKK